MFTFIQKTGELLHDGVHLASGFAGHGPGFNNPAMQEVHNLGPLPCGMYTIEPMEAEHPRLGINVMRLSPDASNEMFGRGGFFLHGEEASHPELSSDGCIIQNHETRLWVEHTRSLGDNRLQVVSGVAAAVSA